MGVLLDIFPQGTVDARLIALAMRRMTLEPRDHVGINPQRELLLDGPKKQAAPCAAPIADFRYVSRIDMIVRQRCQGLALLTARRMSVTRLIVRFMSLWRANACASLDARRLRAGRFFRLLRCITSHREPFVARRRASG